MNFLFLVVAALGATEPAAAVAPAAPPARALSMDDCVRTALKDSGTLLEARGKVKEWEGKLLEVQSSYWPKLQGLTYVAPLYGLKFDEAAGQYRSDWNHWGPYFKLQLILAQPIYSFGRAEAGEKAAQNRLWVEEARLAQTRNLVALEVRRYYLLHLYARSMMPALNQAKSILDEAEKSAKEMYDEGSGSVTQVDLAKLRYGGATLEKYRIQADIGAALALAALKHTMGLPQEAALELADESLPPLPEQPVPQLAELIAQAATRRPEVAQLKFGEEAARAFAQSEKLSSMPVAFVAGQLDLNVAPHWPVQSDPFAWDRFNNITPGVAAGFMFDVDPRKTYARYQGAKGLVEQVEGLKKFAATGIPVEVRKGYDDAVQAEKLTRLSKDASDSGKKWLVFAGAGYAAGMGDAKDLLEGLVAYLTARKDYYENLQGSHFARANLLYLTGRTGVE